MPENPYQSPLTPQQPQVTGPPPPPPAGDDGVVASIIPYKNKASLVAYYSGVFSISACIPVLGVIGVVLAVVAVMYGVKGLRYVKLYPEARGKVHCWIGILGGMIFGVFGLVMQALSIFAIVAAILGK